MTYHGFVTTVTQRVLLVEQELLALREHLSAHPVFSRVRVTQSLVFSIDRLACLAHLAKRQCELLPSLGIRRLSSVNCSHFNLLL